MSKSKKNKAVALRYNADKDIAPVVIASGYGTVADRIIDIAEQRGIPVFRDDSAASMLCMLEVGTEIPEELYQVVAAINVQILSIASDLKHGTDYMGGPPLVSTKPKEPAKPQEPVPEQPEEEETAVQEQPLQKGEGEAP